MQMLNPRVLKATALQYQTSIEYNNNEQEVHPESAITAVQHQEPIEHNNNEKEVNLESDPNEHKVKAMSESEIPVAKAVVRALAQDTEPNLMRAIVHSSFDQTSTTSSPQSLRAQVAKQQ